MYAVLWSAMLEVKLGMSIGKSSNCMMLHLLSGLFVIDDIVFITFCSRLLQYEV